MAATFANIIDREFDLDHTAGWTYKYLYVPPTVSAIYLILVFGGRKWMENREAFKLRRPLTLWNLSLAVFSIMGMCIMLPPAIYSAFTDGAVYAVCNSKISSVPLLSFVTFLFVLSKVVEFGDTIFIVLRKTPLNFLHWYHHITVLMYSWYGLATRCTAGHWFCGINFGVHAVMYSYYTLKAMGYRIPSSVAKSITILQLVQFFVGLLVIFIGMWARWVGTECGITETHIRAGLIMYGSYFILFLNFFYHRYLAPKKAKEV